MATNSRFKEKRPRKRLRTSFALLFIFLFAGLAGVSFVGLRSSILRAQESLLSAASRRVALRFSERMNELLDIGQQIRSAVLREGDKNYGSIKLLADTALNRYHYISAITVAPGAIIRYYFPEENAASSIGHDLLDNPERMQALVQAVSKKQAVIQGPDISADGIPLAFLRIPVFNAQDLWGFVSISIDFDALVNSLSLATEFPGVRIACSAHGAGSRHTDVFWGDERARRGYSSPVMLGSDDSGWSITVASMYPAEVGLWWGGALFIIAILSTVYVLIFSLRVQENRDTKYHNRQDRFDVAPFTGSMSPETEIDTVHVQENVSSAPSEPISSSTNLQNPPKPRTHASVETAISTGTMRPSSQEEVDRSGMETHEETPNVSKNDVPIDMPPSVLVVDDSEVNRELLVRMLTLKGYRVESLQSGELALAMLEKSNFDVVLIDCIMPEMDGYTLASRIKQKYSELSSKDRGLLLKSAIKSSKVPLLIAMSPRHDIEEAKKCEQAGFDGLLIKPFTMTSLDQKIKGMLRSNQR